MINKFSMNYLRNAECLAFMLAANDLIIKHKIFSEALAPLQERWNALLQTAAKALKVEEQNETVRLKNEADRYRDKLHGKLFNYLKSILCDEQDPRFDGAQQLMYIVKEAGNPIRLPENAESVLLAKLCNSLTAVSETLEAVGAAEIVSGILKANQHFVELEKKCRETVSDKQLDGIPSLSAVCREMIPAYTVIADYVNVSVRISQDAYREFIVEMNVLTAKYDAILSARKSEEEKN
jgi:hypothetical protein